MRIIYSQNCYNEPLHSENELKILTNVIQNVDTLINFNNSSL